MAYLAVSTLRRLSDPQPVSGEAVSLVAAIGGVISVHDLHIWSVAPEKVMLSAHLVVRDLRQWETVLEACLALLDERFGIHHVTLQPEPMARTVHWLDARGGPPIPFDGSETHRPPVPARCPD